jgi:hypothetical protein
MVFWPLVSLPLNMGLLFSADGRIGYYEVLAIAGIGYPADKCGRWEFRTDLQVNMA